MHRTWTLRGGRGMSTPNLFPSSSSSLLHFYAYIDKRKLTQTIKVCAKFTARTSENLSR
jgi:hypothetical protein